MAKGKYRDILTAHSGFEKVDVPEHAPYRGLRRVKQIGEVSKEHGGHAFSDPSKGRRVFRPYGVEDPDEARAVPESMYDGTILERIVYKRLLYLYGPPGLDTWVAQKDELGGRNFIGGLAIDFVIYLTRPALALEVQGAFWHGPGQYYSDANRAFVMQGMGYRYAEIAENEILQSTDAELDALIERLVGDSLALYREQYLTHPRDFLGVIRVVSPFKERRF